MPLTLYAHPFAAYCWKALIALYENATRFDYRVVEDAAGWAELESLWPIKKFPLLRDGEATVVESSIIVEYLMRRYPGPQRMIPTGPKSALHGSVVRQLRYDSDAGTRLGSHAYPGRTRCQRRRRHEKDAGRRLWMARRTAHVSSVGVR